MLCVLVIASYYGGELVIDGNKKEKKNNEAERN
jgi:hypothetical protein